MHEPPAPAPAEPRDDHADEAATPVALEALAARLRSVDPRRPSRVDVRGVRGGALGWLLAETLRAPGAKPVLVVTDDLDQARRVAADVGFFLGDGHDEDDAEDGRGDVLVLPAPDTSPYADVQPDRRVIMGRLATLFHLSQGLPWRVLIAPASALVRRVVPRAALGPRSDLVQAEELLDRDKLLAALTEGGYMRVPVVEDPGTFAARGSILDVWPPSSKLPARIELDDDLCLSIKLFEPEGQRAHKSLKELFLHPVREALVGPVERARARMKIRALCEDVNLPSLKAGKLVDDVENGRAFFGSEAYLPAYYERLDRVLDYLPRDLLVVWERPARALAAAAAELEHARGDYEARRSRGEPCFAPEELFAAPDELLRELAEGPQVVLHEGPTVRAPRGENPGLDEVPHAGEVLDLRGESLEKLAADIKATRTEKGKNDAFAPLVEHMKYWASERYRVVLAGRTATQAERIAALLRGHGVEPRLLLGKLDAPALLAPDAVEAHHAGLPAPTRSRALDAALRAPAPASHAAAQAPRAGASAVDETSDDGDDEGFVLPDAPPDAPVCDVVVGELSRGFVLPPRRVALVTEEELFGSRARRAGKRRGAGEGGSARPFIDDLRQLTVGDFVVHVEHGVGRYVGLEHRKLGATEADLLVLEYSSGDRLYLPVTRLNLIQKYSGGEGAPRMDKLGGSTFAKSKARVQRAVRQMADELLKLYAERRAHPGRVFAKPDLLYREFEATFPFEETPDQARAIADVLEDLHSKTPMDRLVCGDVGFGKTEVAIRAAFHVASTGAQVAVLCPTTVLAQQHFNTFSERMKSYPLEVAVLSRFVSSTEQREVSKRLRDGKIDVVIGTHRLLSKDVHFKDLGLLIVDEEQRFGVTHKERIKQLRAQLDVLTLSATPIPRTLQLAVSGLRDLSLITTPPVDRRAVRTVVSRFDPALVREAVQRELARGGQVFYVYNRVEGLYERANKLQELLPGARIAVAHGQMAEGVLEQVMMDFIEGRYDVLCATAIIESGIDIPRANTMLIDRADLFGLSQLYQLRGRVGRSRERAYCYLLVPPPSQLSDDARQRIEAIEKFTDLGAGFQVASLDMELRGAGDLLGAEQSGNVGSVGFELFVQMLEEAVAELRGQPVLPQIEPELTFDEPSFLPEEYVDDVGVRLSLYKRLASARDEDEVDDLGNEMEDRFGPAPAPARLLLRVMRIKTQVRRLRALGIEATRDRVALHLREDSPLDAQKVLELCSSKRSAYRLTAELKLTRRFAEGDAVTNAERVLSDVLALTS